MYKEISFNDKLYAVLITSDENPDNTKFYTNKELDIQMGLVCHKEGYIEPAHVHMEWDRTISVTSEVLHVIKGKCIINFFEDNGNKVGNIELNVGDSILLIGKTGHNLEVLEDFKGFKAKQGPYISMEEDKVFV